MTSFYQHIHNADVATLLLINGGNSSLSVSLDTISGLALQAMVTTAEEAVCCIKGTTYDIVLVDYNLDEVQDVDFVKYIKMTAPASQLLFFNVPNCPVVLRKLIESYVDGVVFIDDSMATFNLKLKLAVAGKSCYHQLFAGLLGRSA